MRDEYKQENAGQGVVQINGNHNTVNYNQHTHHHQHRHTVHAYGSVHLHTHVEAPAFALQAPPAPPARATRRARPTYDISPAQKDVLSLMRPLPKHVRGGILDFMRIEFGTGLVMDLEPHELHRLRAHVLDVRRAAGI